MWTKSFNDELEKVSKEDSIFWKATRRGAGIGGVFGGAGGSFFAALPPGPPKQKLLSAATGAIIGGGAGAVSGGLTGAVIGAPMQLMSDTEEIKKNQRKQIIENLQKKNE